MRTPTDYFKIAFAVTAGILTASAVATVLSFICWVIFYSVFL